MNRYNKLITIRSMIWTGLEKIENITTILNHTVVSNFNHNNSEFVDGLGGNNEMNGSLTHGGELSTSHGNGTHTIELILENPNEVPVYALYKTSAMQDEQFKDWKSLITIEIVHTLGTLCLYAVFVLLATYWAHMLRKIDFNATTRYNRSLLATSATSRPRTRNANSAGRNQSQVQAHFRYQSIDVDVESMLPPISDSSTTKRVHMGPMQSFLTCMGFLIAIQALNVLLYVRNWYDSEGVLLFDAIFFNITSIALIMTFNKFSIELRDVLRTISNINESQTSSQRWRIYAVTLTAYIFFITRILIDTLGICVIVYARIRHVSVVSVVESISIENRKLYLYMYYLPEIFVLVLELVIASVSSNSNQDAETEAEVENSFINSNSKLNVVNKNNVANSHTDGTPKGNRHGYGSIGNVPNTTTTHSPVRYPNEFTGSPMRNSRRAGMSPMRSEVALSPRR